MRSAVLELRPVDRQHILQHELAGVLGITVLVALDVESDDAPTFGEQAFGPAAESAEEVDRQGARGHTASHLLISLWAEPLSA